MKKLTRCSTSSLKSGWNFLGICIPLFLGCTLSMVAMPQRGLGFCSGLTLAVFNFHFIISSLRLLPVVICNFYQDLFIIASDRTDAVINHARQLGIVVRLHSQHRYCRRRETRKQRLSPCSEQKYMNSTNNLTTHWMLMLPKPSYERPAPSILPTPSHSTVTRK